MTAATPATVWLHSLFAVLVHRPPVSSTSPSAPSAAVCPPSPSAEAAASGGDAPAPRQALMGTALVTALLSGVLLAVLVYRELGNNDYSALLGDGDCLLIGSGLPLPSSKGGPSRGGGDQGSGAASAYAPPSGHTEFPRRLGEAEAVEEAAGEGRSDADLGTSDFLHWALRRRVLADNEAAYTRTVQRREDTFDSGVEVRTTVPVYSCALKHRVGSWGEGGKWLCMLPQLTASKPVIYSIGCDGETSFEKSLSELFRVRPFTFDPTLLPADRKAMQAIDYMHFVAVGLAGLAGEADVVPGTVTVEDLMAANGHGFIDIFKIDCEGCEEGFVDALVQRMDPRRPYFGQVLMEIHRVRSLESVNEKIVQKMGQLGFRPFNGEENFLCPSCFEIAFIHESMLRPSDSTTTVAVAGALTANKSARQEALQKIAAAEVIGAEASAATAKYFAELAEEERKQQEAAAGGDAVPDEAAAADAAAAPDAAATTPADGIPAASTSPDTAGVEAAADPVMDPASAVVNDEGARQEASEAVKAEPFSAAADSDAKDVRLAVDGQTGAGGVDSFDHAVGEAGEAATTARDAGAMAVGDGRDAEGTSELLPSEAEGVSQAEASEVEKDPSEMSAEERAAMRRHRGRGAAKKHRKGRKSGPSISMPF